MPQLPVISDSTLTGAIRATFTDAYERRIDKITPRLSQVMDLALPSDKLTEIYAWYLAAPHPSRWDRGTPIPTANFDSRQYSVSSVDWGKRVPYHVNDVNDDQTRTLLGRVGDTGKGFAILPERVFFQILLGSTDADLLDAVPIGADGAALFATTAAGADRFGVTNGNLLPGNTVASVETLHQDLFLAVSQALLFQDGEGQPLLQPEDVTDGMTIIYGSANEEVFRKAFTQRMQLEAGGGANAATSNVVLDAGMSFSLWSTPRITNNDWFIFFNSVRPPIFEQVLEPMSEVSADLQNSDQVRDLGLAYTQWKARMGYGIQETYGAIQIDN